MSRTLIRTLAWTASIGAACVGNVSIKQRDGGRQAADGGGADASGSTVDAVRPGEPGGNDAMVDSGSASARDGGETPTASDGATVVATGPDGAVTNPPPPLPVVQDCSGLAGEGVFEEITPPEVKATFGMVQDGGGAFALAVDPVNQGTLYVGTLFQKLWKSTDCGAHWSAIATGRNSEHVNSGMNWTLAVDPIEPNVVYTNSGYGSHAGLFKSSNGGVDWDIVWPPARQPELSQILERNFANVVVLDPYNHRHLLLTFHEGCRAPRTNTCFAESFDSGATWSMIDGRPEWNGSEGQVMFFMGNSDQWLWGSQSNGFWQTNDRGHQWTSAGFTTVHLQGTQLTRADDGAYYVSGHDGIYRNSNGASGWQRIDNTGPFVGGVVSAGSTLFATTCWAPGSCDRARYLRARSSNGTSWSDMTNSPALRVGGPLGYDSAHSVLFSTNFRDGVWRVVAR